MLLCPAFPGHSLGCTHKRIYSTPVAHRFCMLANTCMFELLGVHVFKAWMGSTSALPLEGLSGGFFSQAVFKQTLVAFGHATNVNFFIQTYVHRKPCKTAVARILLTLVVPQATAMKPNQAPERLPNKNIKTVVTFVALEP